MCSSVVQFLELGVFASPVRQKLHKPPFESCKSQEAVERREGPQRERRKSDYRVQVGNPVLQLLSTVDGWSGKLFNFLNIVRDEKAKKIRIRRWI